MRHKDGTRLGLAVTPTSTLPSESVNALQNSLSPGRSVWGNRSTPSFRQKNQGFTPLQTEIQKLEASTTYRASFCPRTISDWNPDHRLHNVRGVPSQPGSPLTQLLDHCHLVNSFNLTL
ncbi:hypothetical protein DPMN_129975 [Dreissena polymorpha]|uniref:Uncharacterized protein n=1 Tax=Dreissena polymorpha TaxID=45954 RepID=A0A9D4H6R9_DREPO|nr:hypothetical protein DPMN_129975 [Dreissena polymorpha]